MARHGRRGKEKSSHGGRVSTVSSSIESLQGIILTVSWQRSVALTRVYTSPALPHRELRAPWQKCKGGIYKFGKYIYNKGKNIHMENYYDKE